MLDLFGSYIGSASRWSRSIIIVEQRIVIVLNLFFIRKKYGIAIGMRKCKMIWIMGLICAPDII